MTERHQHHDERAGRLLVLIDAAQFGSDPEPTLSPRGGAGRWSPLVAELARVVGLEPAYLPLSRSGGGWLQQVLDSAADWNGPVLVLPRTALGSADTEVPLHLRRAVIASDDSPTVARGARLASLHLLRSGVQTRVVLVLTGETAPPMWEGTGHNAQVWRAELEWRHGLATHIDVVPGDPGAVVRAHSAAADLVVLIWRGSSAPGRCAVVRAVLDEGVSQPCLLLPLHWVESAPVAAGLSAHTGPPVTAP